MRRAIALFLFALPFIAWFVAACYYGQAKTALLCIAGVIACFACFTAASIIGR